MSKVMLINVILEEESRVAIVDNGILDFFEIETLGKASLKGNIYKGVVENVNSALQAAFVNCGWDKPGFLPFDEVNFKVLPSSKGRKGPSRIQDHIAPGREIMVQVIRDKFNNKPPSLTTYYSLPGRYLVLTPYTDASGISRRIEDEEQRAKLKKLVEDLRAHDKYGVIVRTAGLDQDRKELTRDLGFLIRLWETIEQAAGSVPRAPCLIYKERGLALRTIRDHLTDDIDEVWIDDEEVYEGALRFVRAIAPHQEPRVHLYKEGKPLYTRFNLEDQIETIYKRRVPLKSGGEIVIEGTEAMTAIDVNSSRSREQSVEELALRTNTEAAAEIARQLRLRDIGGLIVIDFIDMTSTKHTRSVEKVLLDGMRRDKAKYDATRISKLGILEISRQRLKAAKSTATYVSCPTCDGAGSVRTTEAAAFSALRRIQTRVVRGDVGVLTAAVPQEVALYLLNVQRDELVALEARYAVRIHLVPRQDFPKERCEIETTSPEAPKTLEPAPPAREAVGLRPARRGRAAVSMEAVLRAAAAAPAGGDASSGAGKSAPEEGLGDASEVSRQRLSSSFAPSADDAEVEGVYELAKARQRAGEDVPTEGEEGEDAQPEGESWDQLDEGEGAASHRAVQRSDSEAARPVQEVEAAERQEGDRGRELRSDPDSSKGTTPETTKFFEKRGWKDRFETPAEGSRAGSSAQSGDDSGSIKDTSDDEGGLVEGTSDRASEVSRSSPGPGWALGENPTLTSSPMGSALGDEPGDDRQAETDADSVERKKRRRRGGRGRKKVGDRPPKVAGPIHVQPEEEESALDEAEEPAPRGRVIWEDEEGSELAPSGGPESSRATRASNAVPFEGAPTDAEETASPGAGKKRRRRRGGRGRKKSGPEAAAELATATATATSGRSDPTVDDPKSDEGAASRKRRRRRRGHGKKPESAERKDESRTAKQGPPRGSLPAHRDQGPPTGKREPSEDSVTIATSGENRSEEDVPGGWWSRLRGTRKRSDRDD